MRLKIFICLALAIITFAAFAAVANCSFITLDDRVYVVANPPVQHGFSWTTLKWAFETFHAGYWIPVTWLSHTLDCSLFGLNPVGHHVTNLLFHIANTVLLFLMFQKLTEKVWPSAFVALLFGIHPMHVESVAWIAERKDVLSSFFFILTLFAYVRYVRYVQSRVQSPQLAAPQLSEGGSATAIPHSAFRIPHFLFYALALFFFTLGLMSKPMLVTLPFALLLLDYWPLNRFSHSAIRIRQSAFEKLPFFLLSAIFSYITLLSARSAGAVKPTAEYSLADRFGHVPVSYAWYVLKLFWPVNLSVFYPFRNADLLQVLSASLALLAITIFAVARARKSPYLIFGWLWFLGMLIPVIGLAQAGDQAYADRFAYLPYIGLFVIIAWGVPDLLANTRLRPSSAGRINPQSAIRNPQSAFVWSAAVLVALACFVRTIQEIGYWKNGIILSERAIALDPKNQWAWMALGAEYSNRKNFDKAIDCMTRAATLGPQSELAWHDLGKLLFQKGKYAAAENAYQSALKYAWFSGDKIGIYNDLGDCFASAGDWQQAIGDYQTSLNLNPNQPDTQTKLGQALMQAGQPDQAALAFQDAIQLQPNNGDAQLGLGMILAGSGSDAEALVHLRAAVAADANSTMALNNLAWLLATAPEPDLRNGPEAVSLAEHACQVTHFQKAFLIGTLAAAYAEAGRFDDAVATAQKARDVALANGEKDLAARNAQLIELYKSHHPFRDEGQTKK